MPRRQPSTQKDQINQLWDEVIGTDSNGLVARVGRVEIKIDKLADSLNRKKRSRMLIIKDVVLIMSLLFGGGFLVKIFPVVLKAMEMMSNGGVD